MDDDDTLTVTDELDEHRHLPECPDCGSHDTAMTFVSPGQEPNGHICNACGYEFEAEADA